MPFVLGHNLHRAECDLVVSALNAGVNFVESARLLGVSRHALKRRIAKHDIFRVDDVWRVPNVIKVPNG